MEISEKIYGSDIKIEPVLEELMRSKPLVRLKKINQAGATVFIKENRTTTRYMHSVGVMLLLKHLEAPLEEQIAGLLHDVPHTAFSHVVDFVFPNKYHDHHEKFHEKMITDSEIPGILERYGYDVKRIVDEKNFPLLENNLPDICADRIDYTLRTFSDYLDMTERMKGYLNDFIVHENEIIMSDSDMARAFSLDYLRADVDFWSEPLEIMAFRILADAIKTGLEKGILTEDDLFTDDVSVYEKLKMGKDEDVISHLEKLTPKLEIELTDEGEHEYFLKSKLRYIDPKIIEPDESIIRVSEKFPDYKEAMEEHNEKMKRGFFVKLISW